MGKWMKAIIYIIGSAFLTRLIPFSSFFRNVDTMIHEFGHAVATLLLSGKVMNISLYADHSGVTQSYVANNGSMIPVAMSGYVTASLFAWLLFVLYARRQYAAGLLTISIIAAASLLLFVRNGFGVAWLIGFLILTLVILLLGGKTVTKYYYLLIAFLCLEESVLGPITLLMASITNPSQAGDATLLFRTTSYPAVFWSAVFVFVSLWCAKQSIQAFVGRKRTKRGKVSPKLNGYSE